jgi:hypothetical protein
LHLRNEYKKSYDLELYDIEYQSPAQLREICSLKQPFVFLSPTLPKITSLEQWTGNNTIVSCEFSCSESVISVPSVEASKLLLDVSSSLITENNNAWILLNIPLLYDYRSLDMFLRPSWTAESQFDFWSGSIHAATPLRQHLQSIQYIYVSSGRVNVKMTSDYNTPYINSQTHYSVDAWNMDNELTKRIPFVEFSLNAGYILAIPPYWWFSVQYVELGTQLYVFHYSTWINQLAHLDKVLDKWTTKPIPIPIPTTTPTLMDETSVSVDDICD